MLIRFTVSAHIKYFSHRYFPLSLKTVLHRYCPHLSSSLEHLSYLINILYTSQSIFQSFKNSYHKNKIISKIENYKKEIWENESDYASHILHELEINAGYFIIKATGLFLEVCGFESFTFILFYDSAILLPYKQCEV